MYSPSRLPSRPALWLGLFVAPFAIFAQQTLPPTSSVSSTAAKDEAVVLSPFEVRTDKDTGFVAASALAGGRLNLELKDTPVAYSVITRDFIDALGITDLNGAADWAPNSMKFYDGAGGGDTFNITAPITTRGVGNVYGLRQRNFFVYFSPSDSYSIERYDFGRGPNQILFGNGTVGGQSVSMTKRARVDKPFETVELSVGSWNNYRTVVDVNRPLTDKLAVRAAGVYGTRDGWRKGEFEQTRAVFATATYKLAKNTEVRLEGEIGRQPRRTPYSQYNDNFAGWDGATVFSGLMTDAIRNGTAPTANGRLITNTGQTQGVDRRGSNYFVFDPFSGANAIMNYQNDPFTRGGGATNLTPIGGFLQVGTQGLGSSGAAVTHALNLPGNRFANLLAKSKFQLPSDDWTIAPTVPTIMQKFKDLQLTFSHQLGHSMFFELAGDVNRVFNNRNLIENGISTTYLDVNQKLPDGATNPHFLVPYTDTSYRVSQSIINAESVRGAWAYMKDFGKWGNYSFSVQGGLTHRLAGTRNQFLQTGLQADHRQWASGGLGVKLRSYWNEPPNYPVPSQSITYVDPITSTTSTITPFWAQDTTSFNNANDNHERYNYLTGATNAKFFNGRWVVLGAIRLDKSQQQVRYTKIPGDYPLDWNGNTILWRPDAPANWSTLSYVPKSATGAATGPAVIASARPRVTNNQLFEGQPQYANDRFQDDYNPPVVKNNRQTPSVGTVVHLTKWMSLSANYAKAFAFNSSAAPDPNNQLLPPAQGRGWDAAARFTLFDGKVTASTGYYSNEEFGNYIDPTSVTNNINSLYGANAIGDASTDGRNIRDAGNISGVVRDTRTRIADGFEFEVTANLSRALRLTASYAVPKVWQKDYAPITRAYVADRANLFKQILQDAGGTVGADGRAVAATLPTGTIAIDQANAVSAYNNIYTNVGAFLPDLQIADFQPILNAFTDYTFQTGKLKGLRLGGGVNYRGHKVLGYRNADTIVNPASPLTSIDDPSADGHNAVWAPAYYTVTFTAGYRWRLKDNRELLLNFRLSNLLNNRAIIYTGGAALRPTNGDYASPARMAVPSSFAYLQPFSFGLTATVKM